MNAIELADELINWYSNVNLCVYSAIMLRQQAKEIEELKEKLKTRSELTDEEIAVIYKKVIETSGHNFAYDFAKAIIKASRGEK